MILDAGYDMFYFPAPPPDADPSWIGAPTGQALPEFIQDPGYQYPSMTGAPTYDDARASQYATLPNVERADVDAGCADELAKLDPARYAFVASFLTKLDKVVCYLPGIYQSGSGRRTPT